MIRALLAVVVGLALVGFTANADDKKDATKKLEGTLCCTKCSLSETKTCGHALKVKDGDKEVTYYLNDKGGKETYHKDVCTEDKPATVTGKVSEKDGKKYIDEAKVEIKK